MPQIEFGSRQAANDTRNKVGQFLSQSDSRVEKTVKLKSSIPDTILERVKEEAFESREERAKGAGKAKLSDSEQKSLKRQHSTFNWQSHGFEAMSVKAAVQSEGVTEWMDYYEPGEGVQSALAKVREAKSSAQQTRASQGIGGVRSDTADQRNTGRRARQSERASQQRVKSAKRPAIVESDTEAVGFLQEEMQFGGDPFDVSVSGRREASGRDVELVEERHEKRSEKAQLVDETEAAPTTSNPLKWAQNPDEYDFPGVDTIQPDVVQSTRSERALEADANQTAPIADSVEQWRNNPDQYDLPGVDTKGSDITDFTDDRDKQDTLGFAADPTEARESRMAVEENAGGILEDTRESMGRGPELNDVDPGGQADLSAMDSMETEVDDTMGDITDF